MSTKKEELGRISSGKHGGGDYCFVDLFRKVELWWVLLTLEKS